MAPPACTYWLGWCAADPAVDGWTPTGVNNRAGYRCRHGHTSAQRATPDRAKNLYVREDHILASLPAHLAVLELDDGLDPDEAGSANSGERRDLAELMRRFDLTIMCDTAGWTVETAATTDNADR